MPDADDTDARFRELIEAEYGIQPDEDDAVGTDEQDVSAGPTTDVIPFLAVSNPRAWTPPEPDDEPFVPPPVEPFRPISTTGMLSLILLVAAAVVAVFAIARVPLPWWAPPAGLVCFVVGLGLAYTRLPKDRPPDSDHGAVV